MTSSLLEPRLKRLMFFRVVMVTTLLLIAVYVETVSETLLPVNPLYFLIAGTYGLTLFHVFLLRVSTRHEAQVYVQVVGDLLIVSGLVYLAGGTSTRAGFLLLYPISVLSGSVLVHQRKGLVLAGLATVLYGGLLFLVREGWITAPGLPDVPQQPASRLLYSILVTGVTCATVAWIGGYLSESLSSVGRQLERATGQVADLKELNAAIVRSIQSGLLMVGPGGRVEYVNDYGAALLGRPAGELRGRQVSDLFSSVQLQPSALAARVGLEDLTRFELDFQRSDGTLRQFGLSVSRLEAAERLASDYLLVFQDLTDLKQLEKEARVNEKLAAVGEMAASLAHEIRNPLGSISGSAQVLLGEAELSPERSHLLEIITRESRRLSDTLERFLVQIRPVARRHGPVDVGSVLAEAVALLRNSPEVGAGHAVDLVMDEGPHVCLGDADQIAQVFWNLARNGLEAMPGGGTLRVSLVTREQEMLVTVHDEGCGMQSEQQARIFEPFRSGSKAGTGLGLAIVYRIVREHHGEISIHSEASQGTEVEVRLPLVAVHDTA